MKVLVITQYYYPEPFRISEICESLVQMGHEVFVVTGRPNYPMGKIYKGYEKRAKQIECINGVSVYRCNEIPRKRGVINRFINYYSYVISSTLYVKKLKEVYDVVFVYQLSPVMLAAAGIYYKKKYSRKLVLYCLDLWPESILAGGIKRKSIVYKIFLNISKRIYSQADRILVTSKAFIKYFRSEFNILNVEYFPQFAEEIFQNDNNKKKSTVDLMFAGNVGKAQSVDTIIRAANETKHIRNMYWHIVGDGAELENIKNIAMSMNLKNVVFHGRKPIDEMPYYYGMADAMLITLQKSSDISLTVPGKMQSYMAAGKVILGAINGESEVIIKEANCGYCVSAEDYRGLAKIAEEFYVSKNKKEMEENSKKYYENHFSKRKFISSLENILQKESVLGKEENN